MTVPMRFDRSRVHVLGVLGLVLLGGLLTRLALLDFSSKYSLFHPHGYCYLWDTDLVAVHVISDGLIGVSYVAISATLIYLVSRARTLLPFSWVFVAFGVFIIACGATHLMEVWTLWSPLFWLSGDLKIVTALASVATAVVLPPLLPTVVKVLQDAHVSDDRRRALEDAHAELERRVEERTAQLQQALQRAEEANRAKETFLSTVSHELRTPLNAMLGWARMLNDPTSDESLVRRGLAVIDRNATIQAQLVEDLLDISRLGGGTLQLHTQPVDLVQVVADALEVVRPAAEARHVRLVSTVHPERLPLVGDGRRLQQVVWNLLSNAVKFTPAQGVVAISLSREDARAVIEVTDTGIGIDPSFVPRLFERFSQADTSSTRAHHGVGLGLAIARQLVELHGGTITATSSGPGTGATFRVELPLRAGIEAAQPSDARNAQLARESVDLTGIHVLVVDDDGDTRETLGVMLARAGASVTTAESADRAFEQLQARAFDVVLSDLSMPGRDGYDLIHQVRHASLDHIRHIPAVAISAYARDEDRVRALQSGFHLHVTKPVAPDELLQAISAVIIR